MKFEGGSDLFTTNRHTIHNSSAGTYIYIMGVFRNLSNGDTQLFSRGETRARAPPLYTTLKISE